jgi:hypothetical protein
MNDERELHTSTVLQNGNLLVAGGFMGFGHCEVYVPSNTVSTIIDKTNGKVSVNN